MNPATYRMLASWRGSILIWAALMLLVVATYAAAVSSIAAGWKTVIHFGVVAVQVVLIGVFFMNLRLARGLLWFAAVAGLYWLAIMFVLTFNDYESRPHSSPCGQPGFAAPQSSQCATWMR
jgi:cytochrome c oxidase subunit IV